MNYKESIQILDKIKKSQRILLNCHRGPDPDGIGSTLSMKLVLENMGKKVSVICPSKKITKQVDFLKGYEDIKLGVDFGKYDFSKYDLFITLDTPNSLLLIDKDIFFKPSIFTIVIDHHFLSTLTGDIKLLDNKATSVGEILFDTYKDWGVLIDKKIAECLLTSIMGDTGALAYPNVTSKTLLIVSKLMELGADKDMVVNRIYRSENFDILKFYSEVLSRMNIDKERRFVYSFVPYEVYKKGGVLEDVKAKSASLFAPIVEGTDFGFIGVEERPKYMTISFRGRSDFDTSAIAKELGGGGHKVASAVKIEGLSFKEASKKVLRVVRKYAKKV